MKQKQHNVQTHFQMYIFIYIYITTHHQILITLDPTQLNNSRLYFLDAYSIHSKCWRIGGRTKIIISYFSSIIDSTKKSFLKENQRRNNLKTRFFQPFVNFFRFFFSLSFIFQRRRRKESYYPFKLLLTCSQILTLFQETDKRDIYSTTDWL